MKFLAILFCFALVQIAFGQTKFSLTNVLKDKTDWRSAVNGLFEPRRNLTLTGTGLDGNTTNISTSGRNDGSAIGNTATADALNKQTLVTIKNWELKGKGNLQQSTVIPLGQWPKESNKIAVGDRVNNALGQLQGAVNTRTSAIKGTISTLTGVGDSFGLGSSFRENNGGLPVVSSGRSAGYGNGFAKHDDSSESKEDDSGSGEGNDSSGAGGRESGGRGSEYTGLAGRVRSSSPEEEVLNGYGSNFESFDSSKSLVSGSGSSSGGSSSAGSGLNILGFGSGGGFERPRVVGSGFGGSQTSSFGSSSGWGDFSGGSSFVDSSGSRFSQTGFNSIIRILARIGFGSSQEYDKGSLGFQVIEVLERIFPTFSDTLSGMSDFHKMSNLFNDSKYRLIKEKDSFINRCVEAMKALCNKEEIRKALLYFLNGTSIIKKQHIMQLGDLLSDISLEAMESKEFVSLIESFKQRTTALLNDFNTNSPTWSRLVNNLKQFTETVHNLIKRRDATINEWMHLYEDFSDKISTIQSEPHISFLIKTANATMYLNEKEINGQIDELKENISKTFDTFQNKLYNLLDAIVDLIGQKEWVSFAKLLISDSITQVDVEIDAVIDNVLGKNGEKIIALKKNVARVMEVHKINKVLEDPKNQLKYMLSDGINSILMKMMVNYLLANH